MGRREGPLHSTKKKIGQEVSSDVNVLVVHGDLTSTDTMRVALGDVKQELRCGSRGVEVGFERNAH